MGLSLEQSRVARVDMVGSADRTGSAGPLDRPGEVLQRAESGADWKAARGQTTHRLYDGPWWEVSVGSVWWTGLAGWALRLHDGPQDMRPPSRWGV